MTTSPDCRYNDAYDKLQAMIGLSEAKNTIDQLLDAQKSQQTTKNGT